MVQSGALRVMAVVGAATEADIAAILNEHGIATWPSLEELLP